MPQQYLTIIFSSVMALINAIVLVKYNRRSKSDDDRERRIRSIEADLLTIKHGLLTEERFRRILVEELREFELRLINEGRLEPKIRRKA
jgi:hypothetical protein